MNFISQEKIIGNRQLISLAALLILILGILLLISLYSSRTTRPQDRARFVNTEEIFNNIKLQAQAAFVYDVLHDRIIYSKNAQVPMALASITKVMSALTAVDLLPKNAVVTVNKDFLLEEGDSGLYVDEKWNVSDLIDFTLIQSSNDGIATIAAAAGAISTGTDDVSISKTDFITKMNQKAEEIGMKNAHFFNETGLDIGSAKNGGYASAEDISRLFVYIIKNHPDILEATRSEKINLKSLNNLNHNIKNTNSDIKELPGLLGSKTGYTELAGGNLAIAFDAGVGRPIIVVVLNSTYDGRFQDVLTLTNKTFEYLSKFNSLQSE